MSKIDKLTARFKTKPRDFAWDELVRMLRVHGYKEIHGDGSRRKFIHDSHHLIVLHQPHPGNILKKYQMELVAAVLNEEGHL